VVRSDNPAFVDGWVLPDCDATADEVLTALDVELD
jgi:hypothetical protein